MMEHPQKKYFSLFIINSCHSVSIWGSFPESMSKSLCVCFDKYKKIPTLSFQIPYLFLGICLCVLFPCFPLFLSSITIFAHLFF